MAATSGSNEVVESTARLAFLELFGVLAFWGLFARVVFPLVNDESLPSSWGLPGGVTNAVREALLLFVEEAARFRVGVNASETGRTKVDAATAAAVMAARRVLDSGRRAIRFERRIGVVALLLLLLSAEDVVLFASSLAIFC